MTIDPGDKARRAYEAGLRSGWESNYAGAIEAARAGDSTRLVDLLRTERAPTSDDYELLAEYIEELHRGPGRAGDPTVRDNALVAEALFDIWRKMTGRTKVPDKVRERVSYYVCRIDPQKVDHPQTLDAADARKLKDVERLREYMRKGRHRKTVP